MSALCTSSAPGPGCASCLLVLSSLRETLLGSLVSLVIGCGPSLPRPPSLVCWQATLTSRQHDALTGCQQLKRQLCTGAVPSDCLAAASSLLISGWLTLSITSIPPGAATRSTAAVGSPPGPLLYIRPLPPLPTLLPCGRGHHLRPFACHRPPQARRPLLNGTVPAPGATRLPEASGPCREPLGMDTPTSSRIPDGGRRPPRLVAAL